MNIQDSKENSKFTASLRQAINQVPLDKLLTRKDQRKMVQGHGDNWQTHMQQLTKHAMDTIKGARVNVAGLTPVKRLADAVVESAIDSKLNDVTVATAQALQASSIDKSTTKKQLPSNLLRQLINTMVSLHGEKKDESPATRLNVQDRDVPEAEGQVAVSSSEVPVAPALPSTISAGNGQGSRLPVANKKVDNGMEGKGGL